MRSHPYWDEFEKFLLEHRPVLPEYNYHEDNVLEWKHKSGQREGFDILKNLLKLEE